MSSSRSLKLDIAIAAYNPRRIRENLKIVRLKTAVVEGNFDRLARRPHTQRPTAAEPPTELHSRILLLYIGQIRVRWGQMELLQLYDQLGRGWARRLKVAFVRREMSRSVTAR